MTPSPVTQVFHVALHVPELESVGIDFPVSFLYRHPFYVMHSIRERMDIKSELRNGR